MKRWILVAMFAGLCLQACSKESKDAVAERLEQERAHASERLEQARQDAEDHVRDQAQRQVESVAPNMSVAEVAARRQAGTITIVDANRTANRTQYGVIPDAILLSNPQDVLALPSDKATALVFYCTGCPAAPAAAAAAKASGYTDVSVMGEGIPAWVAAGHEVKEYTRTAADELAPNIQVIGVNALEAGIEAGTHQAVDVNSASTRSAHGVIPGAILLSGAETFASTELPSDKALAFYCSSLSCTAAPKAALRAQSLGFTNVHILSAGIRGWKDAGKTATPVGE